MTYRPRLPKLMWAVMLASLLATVAARASAQSIIDQWSAVPVPPPPKLEKVTIDPKSTALLVMGFVRDSCNQERCPRCVATIPHVKKLLDGARAHGVLVLHSVPTTNPSGDYIVAELAPRPGETIIPPNGPNKFLPYDLEFHRYPDFDLERIFSDHGIRTVITVGTQVQTPCSTPRPKRPCAATRSSCRSTGCRATAPTRSSIRSGTSPTPSA
jgi:hypothetical protein